MGKGALDSSIAYSETMNLFEVSMGRVLDQYGNLDAASSQYYMKALNFQNKLNETFGTNMEETMRYQALYNQMAKSMGINDQASYTISENLTKLGIDLASLFNRDESATMEALRAGVLAGQTKPLRNFGLDVTQQSLAPLLGELGIDRKVNELSQAEKMVLRYIAVLRQASAAHGDFAKTLESPANQLKVMKQQLAELKTAFGNLFQGLVAQILPYVNAAIMIIKELIKAIGSLFGFKVSSHSNNLAQATGVEELQAGLGGASGAAKELKAQLMGFDEINNINIETSSGGGGGGGISPTGIDSRLLDAMKEYDNLMGNVKMKATEIRDNFMDWLGFTKVINPLTGEVSFKLREGWTNLKKIWTLIKGLIGLGVALKIIKLIGNIKNLWSVLKGTSTATSAFSTGWKALLGIFKNVGTSVGSTLTYFKYYKSLGATTGSAFLEASKQGLGLLSTTTKLVGGIGGLALSLYGAHDSMKDFSNGTKSAGAAFTQLGISIGGAAASGALLGSVIPGVGTVMGALGGTVLGLITATIGYENEEEKLAKLSKQHTQERKKLLETFEQQKKLVQESVNNDLAHIEYTEKLIKELNNLVDSNGKVKEGYEDRVAFILSEVNQAYGTELKLIDGQIQGYKEFRQSINDVIATKKAEILLNANEALYAEALKLEKELIKNKEAALNDLNKAHEQYDEKINSNKKRMQELNEQMEKTTDTNKLRTLGTEWGRLNQETERYSNSLGNYQKKYDEACQALVDNMKMTISYSTLQTAIISGNSKEIEKACQELMDTFDESSSEMETSWKSKLENSKLYGDLIIESFGKTSKTITQEEKELANQRMKITIEEMKTQLKTVKDVSPDIIEAYKYLAQSNREAYNEAINGLPEDIRKKIEETTGKIIQETNKAVPDIQNAAKNIRNSLNQNLEGTTKVKFKLESDFSVLLEGLQNIKNKLGQITGKVGETFSPLKNSISSAITKLRGFEGGGFPDMGEIFMARESGPELVGKIGSRTAVANNQQIVESVSRGVYEAVSAAMQSGSTTVKLDVRAEEGIIVKKASQGFTEYVMQTGELPFPVPV